MITCIWLHVYDYTYMITYIWFHVYDFTYMMHIYDHHICAFVLHVYDYTHMLKLDDHFESYMCSYACFLHVYDLHVYDPKHVYDAHICAFRHMTHIYDPVSRCDVWTYTLFSDPISKCVNLDTSTSL